MSGSRDGGRFSGHIVIGEVVDVNDPWQAGHVKVNWKVGSAVQDELAKEDVPWSRCMFPSTNPSLKKMGGPHTGLQVGSIVYGFPVDGAGQDFIVMGSVVKAGKGEPDQQQTPDSELPTGAKQQRVDDIDQPYYGDRNQVAKKKSSGDVVQVSMIQYAHDEAGPQDRPVQQGETTDSIGHKTRIA